MEAGLVVINYHLLLAGITSAVLTQRWSFSKTLEGSGLRAAVLGPRAFTDVWPPTSDRYLHLSVRRPGLWGSSVTAEGWVRHALHPKSNMLYSSVRTIITRELTPDLNSLHQGCCGLAKAITRDSVSTWNAAEVLLRAAADFLLHSLIQK